jgi:hypothetical protein
VVKNDALQTSRNFRKIAKTTAVRKFLFFRGGHVQIVHCTSTVRALILLGNKTTQSSSMIDTVAKSYLTTWLLSPFMRQKLQPFMSACSVITWPG